MIVADNPAQALYKACLNQGFVLDAAFNIIMTAVPERTTSRYRDRGYRYIYMDAAHIGQNILLAAPAVGLEACAVGAFIDDELEAALGIEEKSEVAVYLIAIGKPRRR